MRANWPSVSLGVLVAAILGVPLQRRQRGLVGGGRFRARRRGGAQITHQPVLQSVHPAVHGEFLPAFPGIAHYRGLADIGYLLDHVAVSYTHLRAHETDSYLV